jgi:nitroimidazol reductase NimA-like FMN-containing flavoprotein (pyridoxamine 5'-phosphate oxidase superfamily)
MPTALTRDECVARLSSGTVGRVSVSMGALPVVVPVRYVLDEDSVLFCAPLDALLAAACNGSVIAFEVDDLAGSLTAGSGWSVHVTGIGSLLNEADQPRLQRLGPLAIGHRSLDQVVRLDTRRITGQERHQTEILSLS